MTKPPEDSKRPRRPKQGGDLPKFQQRSQTAPIEDSEMEFTVSVVELDSEPSTTKNPVQAAARLMVARTLEASPELLEGIRQGGVAIVVEVPGADWVEPIADACNDVALWNALPSRSPPGLDEERQTVLRWHELRADGEKKSDGRSVAFALSMGRTVLGFSQSPERHLPKDLLRVADFRVVVSPLDPDGLAKVAAEVTGTPCTTSMPSALCRRVDIADLKLARRPSQSADAYMARLIALVEGKGQQGGLTLDGLHGMPEAVAWGMSLTADLKEYASGRIPWAAVDKGACLFGAPGTGKTTFARALAATCGLPLVAGSLHQWQAAGHLGDLLKAMRKTFEEARKSAPSILFVDEIDSFGDRDSFSHDNKDYSIQVVNGFLEEVDGFGGREGVVLLAACNHPERLDPAIIRSGRLDRMIPIPLPDREALARIFRHHAGPELSDADLLRAATLALGGTGADVERWTRGAKRRARTAARAITIDDLVAEIRGHSDRGPGSARICAVHESGHAVVLALLRPGAVIGATIRDTATTGGGVAAKPGDGIATKETIMTEIMVLLGGRAAEETILGKRSANSGGNERSDLARATALAASMLTAFGFDDGPGLGLLWLGEVTPRNVDMAFRFRPGMEGKVSAILAEAYAACLDLLRTYRAAVEAVASALADHETISGAEVEDLVSRHRPDGMANQ